MASCSLLPEYTLRIGDAGVSIPLKICSRSDDFICLCTEYKCSNRDEGRTVLQDPDMAWPLSSVESTETGIALDLPFTVTSTRNERLPDGDCVKLDKLILSCNDTGSDFPLHAYPIPVSVDDEDDSFSYFLIHDQKYGIPFMIKLSHLKDEESDSFWVRFHSFKMFVPWNKMEVMLEGENMHVLSHMNWMHYFARECQDMFETVLDLDQDSSPTLLIEDQLLIEASRTAAVKKKVSAAGTKVKKTASKAKKKVTSKFNSAKNKVRGKVSSAKTSVSKKFTSVKQKFTGKNKIDSMRGGAGPHPEQRKFNPPPKASQGQQQQQQQQGGQGQQNQSQYHGKSGKPLPPTPVAGQKKLPPIPPKPIRQKPAASANEEKQQQQQQHGNKGGGEENAKKPHPPAGAPPKNQPKMKKANAQKKKTNKEKKNKNNKDEDEEEKPKTHKKKSQGEEGGGGSKDSQQKKQDGGGGDQGGGGDNGGGGGGAAAGGGMADGNNDFGQQQAALDNSAILGGTSVLGTAVYPPPPPPVYPIAVGGIVQPQTGVYYSSPSIVGGSGMGPPLPYPSQQQQPVQSNSSYTNTASPLSSTTPPILGSTTVQNNAPFAGSYNPYLIPQNIIPAKDENAVVGLHCPPTHHQSFIKQTAQEEFSLEKLFSKRARVVDSVAETYKEKFGTELTEDQKDALRVRLDHVVPLTTTGAVDAVVTWMSEIMKDNNSNWRPYFPKHPDPNVAY